jgi:uncharacterized protein YlxW (UPF0749 family)
MKLTRNIALTLVCILLGIMLAWQYKSINYNQSVLSLQNKRVDELKDDYITLQKQKNDLQEKLKILEEQNKTYEKVKAGDSEAARQIQESLQRARVFAGLTDVKGKGVIVTLENNGYLSVEDRDILDVINELRAAGAQAISVNGERIVAMSEVREAGQYYIMVNGKQMQSPYTIKAISDPDDLERCLRLIGGVLEGLEEDQLKVDVKKSDNIEIQRFIDDGTTIKTNLLTPVN